MIVHGPWAPQPAPAVADTALLPSTDAWPPGLLTPEDSARFRRYHEALAFYHGDQWTERPRRNEHRLTFNYARALIRKTASYVFPNPAAFHVVPESLDQAAHDAANHAERLLASLATQLDLPQLDLAMAIESAVLGDAALKVTWDHEAQKPRVVAVDPATLVARWSPDTPGQIRTLTHAYGMQGADIATMFGPSRLDADRHYAVVETWSASRWQVHVAGQPVRDEVNPYGWVPYVIAANDPRPGSCWGRSDLDDLIDVCRELNQRMSVLSRVLELSGAPITVLENVDGSDGISVGPGAKWELPEGAKAYLLDLLQGGGTQMHIAYIDLLFRVLHDLSETPRTAFGDSGRDLSGAALEMEIQPLVQKVGRKRRMWDAVFARRNAMLLDLLERFGGEALHGARRTVTIWPEVLPSDREGAVRNAVSLVQSGIQSRRSAYASLGGEDPGDEFSHILEEASLLTDSG